MAAAAKVPGRSMWGMFAARAGAVLALAICAILAAPQNMVAQTEQVVLGVSHAEVAISTRFDGSDLLIYGAVKRDRPPIMGAPLEVVLTLAGPSEPVTVRRKERRFGIWVNTDSVTLDSAPSFYAVATSAPWKQAISEVESLRHSISVERAIRFVGASAEIDGARGFSDAAIRIRHDEGRYQRMENTVTLREETLFDTRISLPDSLTEGRYPLRVFLTRNGDVVSHIETEIEVRKVGLERWLFKLAHEQALLYGLLSLSIAVLAGWIASAVFTMLRTR